MDIEPSAPCASTSSFPSPIEFQNKQEPSLSYEKLQQIYEGGTSSSRSMYPKFPFILPTSSKDFDLGIDVTSKVFSSHLSQPFPSFPLSTVPTIMEMHPLNTYSSQNKITYQTPQTKARSTSISTLQGVLKKCGIGTIPIALDTNRVCPTSSTIIEKIRNLDDMLKSLEHYSITKRFTNDLKKPSPKSSLNPTENKQLRQSNLDTPCSNQSMTTVFGVNKTLSRLEFKAQMDKLTGVIEDRWFYGDSKKVEKERSMILESSSLIRNKDSLSSQKDTSTITKNSTNISNYLLEEMLQHVVGLEHCLMKKDKQKRSKQKDSHSKMLNVQRPMRKKMTFLLQRQFKQHITSVNHRLDKTDLAIKSLKQQHVKTILNSSWPRSPHNKHARKNYSMHVKADYQMQNLANTQKHLSKKVFEIEEVTKTLHEQEGVAKQDIISSKIHQIEDELCTLQQESQNMSHALEKIQNLYKEQNMEIELCWATINHLCIDNDTFRDELRSSQEKLLSL